MVLQHPDPEHIFEAHAIISTIPSKSPRRKMVYVKTLGPSGHVFVKRYCKNGRKFDLIEEQRTGDDERFIEAPFAVPHLEVF